MDFYFALTFEFTFQPIYEIYKN